MQGGGKGGRGGGGGEKTLKVEGEEARVGSRGGREEDWKRRGWSGAESKIHRLRLS